jgi:hypothetical protein
LLEPITTYLERDVRERLERRAQEERRPIAAMARILITDCLSDTQRRDAPGMAGHGAHA